MKQSATSKQASLPPSLKSNQTQFKLRQNSACSVKTQFKLSGGREAKYPRSPCGAVTRPQPVGHLHPMGEPLPPANWSCSCWQQTGSGRARPGSRRLRLGRRLLESLHWKNAVDAPTAVTVAELPSMQAATLCRDACHQTEGASMQQQSLDDKPASTQQDVNRHCH